VTAPLTSTRTSPESITMRVHQLLNKSSSKEAGCQSIHISRSQTTDFTNHLTSHKGGLLGRDFLIASTTSAYIRDTHYRHPT
jgi:hypothetical protein